MKEVEYVYSNCESFLFWFLEPLSIELIKMG